jgi:hypothetical protein
MSTSIFIDRDLLLEYAAKLMDGHISYGWGDKAGLRQDPSTISKIDCSGLTRYLIYQATDRQLILPQGSWHQHDWCRTKKLERVDYGTAARYDGWLRIAFIPVKYKFRHVWLILNGRTIESHGRKGPNRRPWDTPILKKYVSDCYKLAQTYRIEMGPISVEPVAG